MSADAAAAQFAADVGRDLQRTPRQLQSQYLYDALGSSLFEAICRLPWYRITSGEARLLGRHAHDIAARLHAGRAACGAAAHPVALVELGVGSGEKLLLLVEALSGPASVHLIDISAAALEATAARLAGLAHVPVTRHHGTYQEGLAGIARTRSTRGRTLALFLGSNIGNFDAEGAGTLLRGVRAALAEGDLLLLGADLVKPPADLIRAYDDPLGVTAAFNKNLLVRINAELGGDFDLAAFDHRAVWNAALQRIEMHLVSRVAQDVRIPAAQVRISLAAGESIWTESSYKYTPGGVIAIGEQAGFVRAAQWIDEESRFALTLFTVP